MRNFILFSVLLLLLNVYAITVFHNVVDAAPPERGAELQPTSGSDPDPTRGDVTGGSGANANIKLFDPIDKSIEEIFQAILDIIMVFAIPIVLFFIVWAGFLYVTARGDTSQLEKAHKALLYAVLGGIIVIGAQALLYVITNTIALFGN